MQSDPETGNRILSDATVNRTLGTQNFYGWLFAPNMSADPTTEVDRPKLKERQPKISNLRSCDLSVADSNLPKRNIALLSVLLHGLRASEASALNWSYDGQRRRFGRLKQIAWAGPAAQAEIPSGWLPGIASYKVKYSILPVPVHLPLSSESGERISYDGIRKVVEAIRKKLGWTCMPTSSATLSPLIWFSKG